MNRFDNLVVLVLCHCYFILTPYPYSLFITVGKSPAKFYAKKKTTSLSLSYNRKGFFPQKERKVSVDFGSSGLHKCSLIGIVHNNKRWIKDRVGCLVGVCRLVLFSKSKICLCHGLFIPSNVIFFCKL